MSAFDFHLYPSGMDHVFVERGTLVIYLGRQYEYHQLWPDPRRFEKRIYDHIHDPDQGPIRINAGWTKHCFKPVDP